MNIIQVIGMSHGTQEPMESGRYHDIIIMTSFFAFTKMADSQKLSEGKKRPDFAINLHIFLVWFFKSR